MDTSCLMTRNQAKGSWTRTNICEDIPSAGYLLIPLLQKTVIWLASGTHARALQQVKTVLCNNPPIFSIYTPDNSVIVLANAVSHDVRVCLEEGRGPLFKCITASTRNAANSCLN